MRSTLIVAAALVAAALLPLASSAPAQPPEDAVDLPYSCSTVTVLVGETGKCTKPCEGHDIYPDGIQPRCTDPCDGVTIIVGGSGNCNASKARSACTGLTTVLVGTSGNCYGGNGGPGQDGGAACTGIVVIVLADNNCRGGKGGNGG